MIKLGEEMIEWVKKHNPIHLSKWYCIEKDFTDKEWDAMQQMPEFLPYYKKALKLVGYKYLEKNSDVEPSLKHRWQRVYFKDLRQQEDADADAEVKRKKDIEGAKQTTYNIVVPNDLSVGSNISAACVSDTANQGTK
jgi:hypothetical protein